MCRSVRSENLRRTREFAEQGSLCMLSGSDLLSVMRETLVDDVCNQLVYS